MSPPRSLPNTRSSFSLNRTLLLWLAALVTMMVVAGLAIAWESPRGHLEGRIVLEQAGFGLFKSAAKDKQVYVLARGPYDGGPVIERGVWVQPDGTFNLHNLPIGEYTIHAKAPGFHYTSQDNLFVDEGKTTHLKDLAMHLLTPSVSLGSNVKVFTPKETPTFWVSASGTRQAKISIYEMPLEQVVRNNAADPFAHLELGYNLSLYKAPGTRSNPFTDLKPIKTMNRSLVPKDGEGDWVRRDVALAKPLAPGHYMVTAEIESPDGKTDWNLMWFSVTKLGLIVKQAPDKTWVQAIDLETRKPMSGVQVSVSERNNPGTTLQSGTTNNQGVVIHPVSASQQKNYSYRYMITGKQGKQFAVAGMDFWGGRPNRYETYFYTERPIYRLGQTIYFKGITRREGVHGFKNPGANLAIKASFHNPNNDTLWKGTLRTSQHGTFHGVLSLPEDGRTGSYSLHLEYPNGETSYQYMEVAQYRKPQYDITITPVDDRYTRGETAKFKLQANYFFGGPVPHAQVDYTIYSQGDWLTRYKLKPRENGYSSFYDSWGEAGDDYEYDYGGDYRGEGTTQTDENGVAIIEVATEDVKYDDSTPYSWDGNDQQYTIQATLTDLSRLSAEAKGSALVTAGDVAVFMDSSRYVLKAGESTDVSLYAGHYNGSPAKNQTVTVKAVRWLWDRHKEKYRGMATLAQATAQTDDSGKATVNLTMPKGTPTDTVYIIAETQDSSGHVVRDDNSIWLANESMDYGWDSTRAQNQPLSLTLDKAVYNPGETARLMIAAPVTSKAPTQAIVSIEGRTLLDWKLVQLKDAATLVELPIKEGYMPNVAVSVVFVDEHHRFFTQEKAMRISPESNFLRIAISTEKDNYRPGEEVTYVVQATDPNGKPVPNVELSLGIVDAAIYAIRGDWTQNIGKFFYRRVHNRVITRCSFPEQYSGGPGKDEPRVRKNFKDTAAWFPTLVTDSKGLARTKITLPDNLTTWKATVRAIDKTLRVGENTQSIVVNQPVMVRLALPRFYNVGDATTISAIVHNETDAAQNIAVSLHAPALAHLDLNEHPMDVQDAVEAHGQKRFSWPITFTSAGKATFKIVARGDDGGDAVERSVPIQPVGVMVHDVNSGKVEGGDTMKRSFRFPHKLLPQTTELEFAIAKSTLGPLLSNLDGLLDYPYGCMEQTMSRMLPAMVVHQLQSQLGVPIPTAQKVKIQTIYKKGIDRLREGQNYNGTWGWWNGDNADLYMTTYVLDGLASINRAGLDTQGLVKPSALDWLDGQTREYVKQLTDPETVLKEYQALDAAVNMAYIQFVLSQHGRNLDGSALQWLKEQRNTLPAHALAWQAMAYEHNNDHQEAKAILKRLYALSQTGVLSDSSGKSTFRNWDWSPEMAKALKLDYNRYGYRFSGVESTALALQAIATVTPKASQDIAETQTWLLLQRGKTGWGNTKTTSQVLRTLLALETRSRPAAPTHIPDTQEELASATGTTDADSASTVSITVKRRNGQTDRQQVRFPGGAAGKYGPEQMMHWSLNALSPDDEWTLASIGSGPIYWTRILKYWLPLNPNKDVPVPASPVGLKVKRKFYRLVNQGTRSNGTVRLGIEPLRGDAKAGETLVMVTEIDSPTRIPYVLVESPLASGVEVSANDYRQQTLESNDWGDDSGDASNPLAFIGSWWWNYQDVRDDKIAFFTSSLPQGKSKIFTLIRTEIPGTIHFNPVYLEAMYSPRVRAYSPVQKMTVVER